MRVREGTKQDLSAIADIYAHEVRTALSTFDLEPPGRRPPGPVARGRGPRRRGLDRASHPASIALHQSLGFEEVGVLHEVGRKFGRWIDTAWWQLRLG
jgi:phosphinothricin acetyltransferase